MAARFLIGLLLLGAAASLRSARELAFVHDSRSLVREDPAAERAQRELVRAFGSEDILLVAWEAPDVLDPREFARLERITRALGAVEGLEEVYSLASDEVRLPLGGGLRALRPEDLETPEARAEARRVLRGNPVYLGTLYNSELNVVAIAGTLAPGPAAAKAAALAEVRRVVARLSPPGRTVHIAGVTALAQEASAYAFADLRRVGLLALPVCLVVLLLACGSWLETLIALGATALPPLFALGAAARFRVPVTALGAALFPVLGVVGITGSVHLLHASRALEREGLDRRAAVWRAARTLAAPILLSLATTAAAFASLAATRVPALRSGGLLVALGLALAAPVLLAGLPAALQVFGPGRPPRREGRLAVLLEKLAALGILRRRLVLVAGLVLLAMGCVAALRARVQVEVLQAFRPGSSIARTYRFLDQRLTATVPLDVVLLARPETSPEEAVADLRAFHARIRRIPQVRSALSLATLVDYGKRAVRLPLGDAGALAILNTGWPRITRRFWEPGSRRFRVKLRVREGTPPAVLDKIRSAARGFRTGRAELTGLFVRAVATTRRLVADLARGILAMGLLVALAAGVCLRSFRLGLAALPPNLLPPAVVFGALALAGAALDVAAVAVGAVAVGLAVDDTLHVLFGVRRLAPGEPLERAWRRVGPALLLSTMVLVAGLACVGTSGFVPTRRFGLWTAAACGIALPADLLLLPALTAFLLGRPRSAPGLG